MLCICTASAQKYYLLQTATGNGGGSHATSSGYKMGNTIGQSSAGFTHSSGFSDRNGFWQEYDALQGYFNSTYAVADGWNMISLPKLVADYHKDVLYPSAVSKAFAYTGSYTQSDLFANGNGYWLKYSGNQLLTLPGTPVAVDTIAVKSGWNIIGSIGSPVNTSAIVQIPSGIVTSNYFGYNGGYAIAGAIAPGSGYWVKCNGPGQLVLSAPPMAAPVAAVLQNASSSDLNTLTVTVLATGAKHPAQTLQFASAMPEGKTAEAYAMPPAAPAGFDVRFTTNRYAEFFSGENALKEIPINIQTEENSVTLSWKLKEKAGQVYVLLEKQGEKVLAEHRPKNDGTMTIHDINKKTFSLKLEQMPLAFALQQNYPNPFNPATVIQYSLPAESHVTVKIYDAIGREVTTLVDGQQPAGYQTVQWNASNFASGMYFCRMTATGTAERKIFTDVRKMLLIK
jgi:hypothetical protein